MQEFNRFDVIDDVPMNSCPVIPGAIDTTPPKNGCEDGKDGLPGKDGKDGINGTPGKSAYQIALDNGFQGTEKEWLASLDGKQGAKGEKGESYTTSQLITPIFITPPLETGKLRALNDPQKCLFDNGIYHQWYLLNDNADINHKTETDNHGMGGGTVWQHTTSTDLVKWTNQEITLDKGKVDDKTDIQSVMTGSALKWNNEIHYFASIDIGEGGKSVGHWVAPDLETKPVWKGIVLQNLNMETFRDPHVFEYNGKLKMVIAVDGGISIYSSINGTRWEYSSTTTIPGLGLIECPQLVNSLKYGWLLVYGANEYLKNGTTGTHIASVGFDGTYVSIIQDSKVDVGTDYYAGTVYQNQNGELYCFGWINSWSYFPNIMQDGFNGYITVNRIENIGGSQPSTYKFIQMPMREIYTYFNRTIESNVVLEGDYSNLPLKNIPQNCLQEITIDNGDIADGCYFEITHGGSNSFKILRDGKKKGWWISRTDYGLRPAIDIYDWNKAYFVSDDKASTGKNQTVIHIAKYANAVQVYIDYRIAYSILVYFPLGNPVFRFHGNQYFNEDGTDAGKDSYKAFYKIFYADLINGVDGSLTKQDVEGMIGKSIANGITTFASSTEDLVKQITVDKKDGIVVRKQLGSNVNDIEKGLKGVLVHALREPLLIETQNDADHVFVKKLIVDKNGYITIEGTNGSVEGKLINTGSVENFIETTNDATHLKVKYLTVDPKTGFISFENEDGSQSVKGYFASDASLNEYIKTAKDANVLETKLVRVDLKDNKITFSNAKSGDELKEIGGYLSETKNILNVVEGENQLQPKYIAIDKKTGYITFTNGADAVKGYMSDKDSKLFIETANDYPNAIKVDTLYVGTDGSVSFIDNTNNRQIRGTLLSDKSPVIQDYIKTTKGTTELTIKQIKYDFKTKAMSLIGTENVNGTDAVVDFALPDTSRPVVYSVDGKTNLNQIEFDADNDQLIIVGKSGKYFMARKPHEYITSIELVK